MNLNFQTTSKPEMYYFYMDDTFVVFSNEYEGDRFLHSLNSFHPSLCFTLKKKSLIWLYLFWTCWLKNPPPSLSPPPTGNPHSVIHRSISTLEFLQSTEEQNYFNPDRNLPSCCQFIASCLPVHSFIHSYTRSLIIKSSMAKRMKQFHTWRKFGPERCLVCLRLPWLGSVSTRFRKQVVEFAVKTVLFRCETTRCLLYQRTSLRYQQGCTACFAEKQRGLSILMPLRQSVCRPYLLKAAGQN